ncbi:MAG: signal peptidase I [Ruminococcus sp.]|nr:signal peptidase I [Ruminococcus sp.]
MEEKKLPAAVRIIRAVYDGFATLIIAAAAVTAVLWIAGIRPYVVVSGSMEPAIHVGSVCVINQHSPYDSIEKGDIIAFRAGSGVLVTHRAAGITEEGIVTKGDANNAEDLSPVTKENYIGRTIFSVPKLGYAVRSVRTKGGLISAAAGLAAFVLIGLALPDKKREKKKH